MQTGRPAASLTAFTDLSSLTPGVEFGHATTSFHHVAIDRERLLQSAAKHAEKKKYDRAIADYQRIIEEDPRDARTLLKIGDLQSKMLDYRGAVETYNQVADHYARQGFHLKAIAVFKQIRELIRKHAPDLSAQYAHITPRLAEIYARLNLITDALAAYDEVATLHQKAGRDRDAIEVFKKTVALDPKNPLPHLRLAEACCRVQAVDQAIDSFWTAAELLLGMQRPEDALKVIERILHFRQDPVYARAAAELYLKRGEPQAGMQALAKLQIAFQANPKDLQTLALLAQAFQVIGQPDKALAVHLEMARLARDQGQAELWEQIMAHLEQVAPSSDQVMALRKAGPPQAGAAQAGERRSVAPAAPQAAPPSASDHAHVEAHEVEAVELDDEVEYLEEPATDEQQFEGGYDDYDEEEGVDVTGVAVFAEESSGPGSFQPAAHVHKAIVDAESFRRLGLLDKAVEALHIALEIDPNSVPIREKLREVLVDAGEREPAIQETINIAIIHIHNQEPDFAEPLALEVLEIEPEHPDALNILQHVQALREAQASASADGHLQSYDMEGVRPSSAMSQIPRDAPLPSFDMDEVGSPGGYSTSVQPTSPSVPPRPMGRSSVPPSRRPSPEAIEEVLEEAEFFAAQGLYGDAEAILRDMLQQVPGHVLLSERLQEVREGRAGAPVEPPPVIETPDDKAFDIAASLDALDDLDQPPQPQMSAANEEVDVDQVFAKFKEGVKATVADNDAATHYDLGLAYKEMGLLPDARSEFELASQDPERRCMCYAMIGLIYHEVGDLDEAKQAYQVALDSPGKTPDQEKSLLYDLAMIAEADGDMDTYLGHLKTIAQMDPGFRDVSARIRALGDKVPERDNDDDDLDAAFANLLGN